MSTSAPRSASSCVAYGAGRHWPKSSTRIPVSSPSGIPLMSRPIASSGVSRSSAVEHPAERMPERAHIGVGQVTGEVLLDPSQVHTRGVAQAPTARRS